MKYKNFLSINNPTLKNSTNNNPQISELGFGGTGIAGMYSDGSIQEGKAIAAIHRAFELGVNYFDTAPYYGITNSERVLGKGLKDLPREKFILSTKVGRYGFSDFDFSAEKVLKGFEESIARLQVDYVDLLIIHDIEFGDLNQVVNETLPALDTLRQSGKVRYLGISGYPIHVLNKVVETTKVRLDVVLSYCHFTLFDQSLESYAKVWDEKYGVSCINASPLGMALLTNQGPPEWHPSAPELKQACRKAADYCKGLNDDISKFAVQFAVHHCPGITTLQGFQTVEEVEKAINWIQEPVTSEKEEQFNKIKSMFEGVPQTWPSGING